MEKAKSKKKKKKKNLALEKKQPKHKKEKKKTQENPCMRNKMKITTHKLTSNRGNQNP
jgi:hypothetical protein